jgi:hypothetical protein
LFTDPYPAVIRRGSSSCFHPGCSTCNPSNDGYFKWQAATEKDLDAALARAMTWHLFACLRLRDFNAARASYERLLGEPTFFPHGY